MQPPGRLRRSVAVNARPLVLAAVLVCLSSGLAAAAAPSLKAVAGLGGVARPGRWMPVRVTLETAGQDLDGDLVAEWGGAVVRHAASVTAPGRKDFNLLLRTSDPAASVTIRFESPGASPAVVEVAVQTAAADAVVTLCVTAPTTITSTDGCTATMAPEVLPRSPRGYDAADRVVWSGAATSLAPEQHLALEQWRSIRRLEDTGEFTAVPELPHVLSSIAGRSRIPWSVLAGAAAYLAALAALAQRVRAIRIPTTRLYGLLGLVIGAAVGAALVAGRAGPASAIVLHHVSVVQQVADPGVTLVSMRAVAVFPAFDSFVLRADVTDGAMRPDTAEPRSREEFDGGGHPIVSGRYGLGARQPVSVDATIEARPFDLSRQGGLLRITNTSDMDLRDCRIAAGSSREMATSLARGASVEMQWPPDAGSSIVTCTGTLSPISFTSGGHGITTAGSTTVAAFATASDVGRR